MTNLLQTPHDPPPVVTLNPQGTSPILLIGDHAGRAVPSRLEGLGVAAEAMDLHIAWDIGVMELGRRLSARLDAPFIAQAYSRLVIDCNRRPDAPDAMPRVSDGVEIPGNAAISVDAAQSRRLEIHQPYQDAIAAALDDRAARSQPGVLVSLHSFTPVFEGFERPWRMGVLHRNDSALSSAMLALLRAELGEAAGDNQPYRMDEIDYTVPLHADARGLDYLELEVRQDLIADTAGQEEVAESVARLLTAAIAANLPPRSGNLSL